MTAADRRWLDDLRCRRDARMAGGEPPARADRAVLRGALLALATAASVDPSALDGLLEGPDGPPDRPAPCPAPSSAPELLGRAREVLLDPWGRRAAGAHYTPAAVVDELCRLAWSTAAATGDGPARTPAELPVVLDPAVGGGAFLLGAARRLAADGADPAAVVADGLVGVDTDALAVEVAVAALSLWAATRGAAGARPRRVVVGDALDGDLDRLVGRGTVDLVVGNPPFLGQLRRATAHDRPRAASLRARYGAPVAGYADGAAAFVLAACDAARPGGVVALVLPRSFLSARDAGATRAALLERASVAAMWAPDRPAFRAAVQVCAPVLRVGAPLPRVRRPAPPTAGGSWAPMAATAAPEVALGDGPPLGRWCHASASFRDEYYGLAPCVVDDEGQDDRRFPPLVTCGLIDPARSLWGERPARYARRAWTAPRVDLSRLVDGSRLARWTAGRLVPKVLVATQTRVLEAVVDPTGAWVPSTPVVSVVAPPERLWHVAAVLLSPAVTAWARREHAGAAMGADAIKLRAGQVAAVPCPPPGAAWDAAARAVAAASAAADAGARRSALEGAAVASVAAYGIVGAAADDLVAWWAARLPPAPPARRRALTGPPDAPPPPAPWR